MWVLLIVQDTHSSMQCSRELLAACIVPHSFSSSKHCSGLTYQYSSSRTYTAACIVHRHVVGIRQVHAYRNHCLLDTALHHQNMHCGTHFCCTEIQLQTPISTKPVFICLYSNQRFAASETSTILAALEWQSQTVQLQDVTQSEDTGVK